LDKDQLMPLLQCLKVTAMNLLGTGQLSCSFFSLFQGYLAMSQK
jgi:hypothetical protein